MLLIERAALSIKTSILPVVSLVNVEIVSGALILRMKALHVLKDLVVVGHLPAHVASTGAHVRPVPGQSRKM